MKRLKKSCTKMSDKDVEEAVDAAYKGAGKLMSYFGSALELSTFVVSVIELQEIELALIDSLLDQQTSITSPLYQGLGRLRDDIAMDISGHITEKYLDEFAVKVITSTLKTMIKEGVKFLGADMPGSLATLTAKVLVKLAVKLYPSVTADKYIEAVIAGNFVSITESNLIQKKMYFLKNYASSEDIIDYELRYQAYLAAMQTALSTACVLADAKDDSSVYWGAYYSQSSIAAVSYEVYIKMCLATVQEAIKSGNISAPSSTPDVGSGEEEEEKDNTETIQSRLAALQSIYKPNVGQAWTDSWGGAIQCYGFVRMIFSKLYGCEMPYCYVNNARYKYTNENNVVLVGQLVGDEVTASSIKSLMSNARLGDVIQACGKTQHTMMVMSVNDDGIVVYDCNWKMNSGDGDCLIYTHSMSYDYLAQRYSQRGEISENGFSLYRAANYSSVYGDGSNFMYDDSVNFVIEEGVLVKYNGWQSNVVIPDTVTAIGASAFKGNTYMRTVTIPDGVTEIGNNAFENCTNLFRVNMPDSLLTIGISSFQNCSSLFYVCIPDSVTMIASYAFNNCTSLSSVQLSDSLEYLGHYAFGNCTGLTSIHIPKTLDAGDFAWSGSSSWKSEKEWKGPFYNCTNLKDVTFEEGTTQIAEYLFMGCYGLEEITIPNTVTVIENSAFMQCKNLANVVIPDSVTQIGSSVFQECIALKEVDIPDSVTIIDDYAFYYCELLEKVELSKNLTGLGACAFGSCDGITEITIPKSLDKGDWSWSSSSSWKSGKEWSGPFYNCTNLKDVTFEEGTTQIAEYLFMGCYGLEEITIPNTVTVIEQSAFKQCKNLANVVIPDSVTQIDSGAFQECTSLTEITIPNTVTEIRDYVFYGCSALSKVQLPNAITKIPNSAFESCTALTGITIPDTVKTIGSNAFRYCTGLNAVVIPDSVTDIYSQAFKGATALESVTLGKSITGVPIQAFMDCTALTSVTFGGNETTISSDAFRNCTALDNVVIPDSVTNIYGNAFRNCDSLKNITLGKGIKTISDNCFSDCDSLESIVIPKGVTSIGSNVFVNDTKLTSITIPVTVTSINANAFSYPDKLTIYGCAGSYAETFAKENSIKFVNITKNITGMLLEGSEDETLRIIRGTTVEPGFEVYPADNTDIITLASGDTGVVTVKNENQLYGNRDGTATVTATATGGMTYDFTVVVRSLSGIEITSMPAKIAYDYGDELDLTGMVVTATYTDGTSEPVTGYTVTGFDSSKEGEQTLTVSYKAYNTKTDTFTVTLADSRPKLTAIQINTYPTKLVYAKGDSLDTTGMTVDAVYSNGTSATVNEYTCYGYNSLKSGVQNITINFSGITTTFRVFVTTTENVYADTSGDQVVFRLNGSEQSVDAGSTIDLTSALPSDLSASKAVWESRNSSVATVSNGIVTGKAGGTAVITATNADESFVVSFEITVSGEAPTRTPGDANGDGRINMMDVTIMCRYLAEWDGVVINESNSDVNGDGRVNMMDVTVMCRYLAEWDGVVLK